MNLATFFLLFCAALIYNFLAESSVLPASDDLLRIWRATTVSSTHRLLAAIVPAVQEGSPTMH